MFLVGIISFYTSVFEQDNYIFVYHDQVQQFNFEINQWDRCTAFRFTFKTSRNHNEFGFQHVFLKEERLYQTKHTKY